MVTLYNKYATDYILLFVDGTIQNLTFKVAPGFMTPPTHQGNK